MTSKTRFWLDAVKLTVIVVFLAFAIPQAVKDSRNAWRYHPATNVHSELPIHMDFKDVTNIVYYTNRNADALTLPVNPSPTRLWENIGYQVLTNSRHFDIGGHGPAKALLPFIYFEEGERMFTFDTNHCLYVYDKLVGRIEGRRWVPAKEAP